jgi:hypothetical protein
MPASDLVLIALGAALLAGGVAAQLRTGGMRRRWAARGMGLTEHATGLRSLAAVPVYWPAERALASELEQQVAIIVLRESAGDPQELGRRLAGVMRQHEVGWRVDYDLLAATVAVPDERGGVRAAARIVTDVMHGMQAPSLRIGIARAPHDGTEFLDLVDVAMTRLRTADAFLAAASSAELAHNEPSASEIGEAT